MTALHHPAVHRARLVIALVLMVAIYIAIGEMIGEAN
jgi:hypothetical protein